MSTKIKELSKIGILVFFLVILTALISGCTSKIPTKEVDVEKPPELKLITGISTTEDSESINILIKGNSLLTYTSVKQPFPLGVILYFPETALDNVETPLSLDNDMIDAIKASELTEKGHTSKIEISLKKDTPYEVTREGMDINISFPKVTEVLPSAAQEEKETEISEIKPPEEVIAPETGIETAATLEIEKEPEVQQPGGLAWVNRIDFSSEEAGKSIIIIGTTKSVQYKIEKVADKRLQLKLFNTRIPDYRKLPLITTRFESAVDRITPVQKPEMENISIVTIELREAVPYFVEQADNLLLIHFAASSIPPRPFEEAKLPSWKQVIAQTIVEPEVTEAEEAEERLEEELEVAKEISIPEVADIKPAKKYTGEKIALDFFGTDIKNVFRILREVSKRNFAIDENVKGKVTLTFDKPVPWDQVLDLILKMNQLGRVYEGNIIRIATLKTLQKEDELRRVKIELRRAKIEAELEAQKKNREDKKALEPLVTEYIPISYSNAKIDILPHLSNLLTKDRGSLSVDERTNLVIITDTSDKIEQAKQIVQKLDVVTPQVIIEARIVEASTNFSREIGIEWAGGVGVQPTSLFPSEIGPNAAPIDNAVGVGPARGYNTLGGTYGYNTAMNFPITSTTAGSIGFNFVKIAGTPLVLNAKLLAMETEGEVKIISAPKIITLDNKTATIKQGLSYPYNKLDDSGNTITTYKDIDLVLEVTPHVTPDNRISMKINIKKNDLGDVILGQQSFTTKEAQTELLVNDGDTIVIGGIITKTKRRSESGLPGLSKIPIIGWLFKSKIKSDRKEELLIFITCRIVYLEQRAVAESY